MSPLERPVYLDYNATTPVDPKVLEAMLPFYRESFGNPSSVTHSYGWEAKNAVEAAYEPVAKLIGVAGLKTSRSLIWTAGATESTQLALHSAFRPLLEKKQPCHLITSQVEHKATLDVAHDLERLGAEITFLKPDQWGRVAPADVKSALRPHTRMVSLIHANNEIGTLNPINEIAALTARAGVLFHVDAAQSVGKVPINVHAAHIDYLSASGHKFYAPKGVGFLYVRPGLDPIHRPGTLNVPGIVGLAKACALCLEHMDVESARITELRDRLINEVLKRVRSARLNGHPTERVHSNASFSFYGLSADVFALGLPGLAVSSGSACLAGEASHVLAGIGLPLELARATLRIGIGRFTTAGDIDTAVSKIETMAKAGTV